MISIRKFLVLIALSVATTTPALGAQSYFIGFKNMFGEWDNMALIGLTEDTKKNLDLCEHFRKNAQREHPHRDWLCIKQPTGSWLDAMKDELKNNSTSQFSTLFIEERPIAIIFGFPENTSACENLRKYLGFDPKTHCMN